MLNFTTTIGMILVGPMWYSVIRPVKSFSSQTSVPDPIKGGTLSKIVGLW